MEQVLAIGLPFLFAFGGVSLIYWANGRKQNTPQKEKSAGYQISYNGTNFVWLHKDGNKHEGTLHFTDTIKFDKPLLTRGICMCDQHGYKMNLEISMAFDVKDALQKFIVANW